MTPSQPPEECKCLTCGKTHNNKKFCSRKCYGDYLKTLRGNKAPHWKDGKIRRESVHQWLYANYGSPRICEIGKCTKETKFYDWALKKGCEYEKKRENFMRLCRSCHRKYDNFIPPSRKGTHLSMAAKKKLSECAKLQPRNKYGFIKLEKETYA